MICNPHDYSWIATRQKEHLDWRDIAKLKDMRNLWKDDPHIVALVDNLLAP